MKPVTIGAILICLLLVVGFISYIVISEDTSPIPPYDGDEDSNPDSGNGADDNQVTVAVKITAPSSDPYYIPETGCEYGKFAYMRIEGYVYGLNATKAKYMCIEWAGTDYSRSIMTYPYYVTERNFWKKVDDYNTQFREHMLIQRLATGSHLLKVKVYDKKGGSLLAEASLEVVIPQYWKYHWDYRNPAREDAVWHGDPNYCSLTDKWSYAFIFPYRPFPTLFPDEWYYLEGKIVKAVGQLYVKINCDYRQQIGRDVYVETTLYDGAAGKWYPYSDFDKISVPCNGWSNSFEVNYHGRWGNEIGFTAWCNSNMGTSDIVYGFVGDVYVVPGTQFKDMSPLSILMSFFTPDEKLYPPLPDIPSCNECGS